MREEKAKDRREGLEEGNKVIRGVQSGGLGSPMLKFGGGGGAKHPLFPPPPHYSTTDIPPLKLCLLYIITEGMRYNMGLQGVCRDVCIFCMCLSSTCLLGICVGWFCLSQPLLGPGSRRWGCTM